MSRPRLRRRIVLLACVIVSIGAGGIAWLAAHRDIARQRAVAKYEQILPGMTAEQVEEIMVDLPADTCYSSRPGGTFISVEHRFNINTHFATNGVLARKYLIEATDSDYSTNWYWLTLVSRKFGFREYRQWP